MSMTDPIADMLTRLRNGIMAKHEKVVIPFSKIKEDIAIILKDEGFIENFKVLDVDNHKSSIKVYLKYLNGNVPAISGLTRRSKPGSREYVAKDNIPVVVNGIGIAILSTNKGIMTDRKCREIGVGGELICCVW